MIKYFIYRFPIFILIFTTLAIIISSMSVFGVNYNYKDILLYLFTGLVFLFHIRVVDDYRDFEHDTKYYSERELQKGKLDIKKLFISAEFLIIFILILNYFYFGIGAIFILFLGWLNSLASISYFGYGKKIEEKYMILYHILNNFTLNTFFIYLYYNNGILNFNTTIIFFHFVLLNLMVFLLEITRKIKSIDEKDTNDKYIDKYGYKKNFFIISFILISIFFIINYLFFYLKLDYFSINFIFYCLIFLIIFILNILHLKYKIKKYKNGILLFSLIFYLFSGFIFF